MSKRIRDLAELNDSDYNAIDDNDLANMYLLTDSSVVGNANHAEKTFKVNIKGFIYNIVARVNSLIDVLTTNLSSHISNTSNPHDVTKNQVGLGDVVNVDTSTTTNITDSTNKRFVTDSEKTVLSNTSNTNSGDETQNSIIAKLGSLWTNITAHISNTSNPHNVTKSQIGLGNVENIDLTSSLIIVTSNTTTLINANSKSIVFTGTNENQIVNLGNATTYVLGKTYQIISDNTEVISIVNHSGTEILRLEPYNKVDFILKDNTTESGVWTQHITFAPANRGIQLREEFNTGTVTSGQTNFSGTTSGTGATATSNSTLNGRRAVYQFTTGTTNTGRVAFHKSSNGVLFGNDIAFCYETQIFIPTLSTAANRYLLYVGYGDNIVAGDHLDGVYFEYDEGLSGNFWRLKTSNNNAKTTVITTAAVIPNAWQKLRIEVNRAGTNAKFFVNGVFVNNITNNIPTSVGRNTDLLYKINKTAGNTPTLFFVDYCSENTYVNR